MRSKFEEFIADLLTKKKIAFSYESDKIVYTLEQEYIPDFKIGNIYIEAKGWFRPSDRKKLIAVKKQNPDKDIRLWFQQDNYLTKSKKAKYSDWAKKNNFKYHVGKDFPSQWFKKKKN